MRRGMPSNTSIGTALVLSYGSRDLPYDGHDRYRSAQSRSIARCVTILRMWNACTIGWRATSSERQRPVRLSPIADPVVVQLLFDRMVRAHSTAWPIRCYRAISRSIRLRRPWQAQARRRSGCRRHFNVTVNEGVMAAGFTGNCCICVQSSRFLRLASTAAVQSSNTASSRSASIRAASAWNAGKSPTDDAKSARTPTNAFPYAAHASHTSVQPSRKASRLNSAQPDPIILLDPQNATHRGNRSDVSMAEYVTPIGEDQWPRKSRMGLSRHSQPLGTRMSDDR